MIKVAIIMSVYRSDNKAELELAVNSMLSQTYKNIDIFLYRDGEVPSDVQCYLDSLSLKDNINVIEGSINSGLANALNKLIDLIVNLGYYEYIARMDADDISRPQRIERQVEFLNANDDIHVCGTSCREFGASFALSEKHLPQTHNELRDFSITRCPFIHPSVMFRSSIFHSGIRYPTNTSFTEDMALWFELLSQGYKFSNINEVLLDYRLNESTVGRRKGLDKAVSEVRLRFYYMLKLHSLSIKSVFLIFSRFAFHLLPDFLMRFAYKNARNKI